MYQGSARDVKDRDETLVRLETETTTLPCTIPISVFLLFITQADRTQLVTTQLYSCTTENTVAIYDIYASFRDDYTSFHTPNFLDRHFLSPKSLPMHTDPTGASARSRQLSKYWIG